MMNRLSRNRSSRGGMGSGLVAILGLVEIAVLIYLLLWARSAGACAPPQLRMLGNLFGPQQMQGGNGAPGPSDANNGNQPQPRPVQTQSADQPTTSGGDAGGAQSTGTTSGNLNDVPDPNCVGKTTASLLNSDSSTPPPSCAPMKAPPELQKAAQQVQGLGQQTDASPTP